MTTHEISLLVIIISALLIGAAVKHYRERHRIPPPAELQVNPMSKIR